MSNYTIPLSLSAWTETPTAVSVTSIVRGDNGQPPAGQSFPISLTISGNTATGTFSDSNTPPALYLGFGTATFADGSTGAISNWQISGSATPVTGFWTSQTQIEQYLGQFNADQYSNLNNTGVGPDPAGFQDAITRAEAYINYLLQLYNYPSGVTNPQFPTSSFAFQILSLNATILGAEWCYIKRGALDQTDKLAGAMAKAADGARKEIRAIIVNKIVDVSRGISSYPAVILANQFGFGTKNPVPYSANSIPEYP